MHFEGNKEVFRNLFRKQGLLEKGCDDDTIRVLLIMLPGIMRGAFGGGQVISLEAFGLTQAFDVVVGSSTGAPIAGYLLGGQAGLGTSVYIEECTGGNFLNLFPPRADVSFLADVFRGSTSKALDVGRVRASRPNFFVAVTDAVTGEGKLIDAKATPDLVQVIKASIAIPGFNQPVPVEDGFYLDGGGACPFPVREAIARFNPTDILVLANSPENDNGGGFKKTLLTKIATAKLPKPVKRAFVGRIALFQEELNVLREQSSPTSPRCAIIWSDGLISSFEQDKGRLIKAVDRAKAHLSDLLTEARNSI